MDWSEAGFKKHTVLSTHYELTGFDDSGPFSWLCCVTRPNNLAALETRFKLLADGWRRMKACTEVFLGLFSSPQTSRPCADTWMLALQYHLTSGIYVSKFQPKPRKCQSEQREAWGKGTGAASLAQEGAG